MKLLRGFFCAVFLLAIFSVLGSAAWGQTNASLRGTVTDQSGGIVIGDQAADRAFGGDREPGARMDGDLT